jgi:hypothetical protein
MTIPIEHPKATYANLPPEEREFVDKMMEFLFQHAQRIPSLKRLPPEKAKDTVISLMDLGLLRLRKTGERAWWEIHNGKAYIPI